jgi:tRNA nucleotidyltransferase (CCA-adding enzyme)
VAPEEVPPGTGPGTPAADLARSVPAPVHALIDRLVDAGHGAYLVGGSLRDLLAGRVPVDWDLASSALPDELVDLLPGAVYENQFGTVVVRRDGTLFEITTFRIEHEYADFRRPHKLEFGRDLDADLARRDFTVNALAWGREPHGTSTPERKPKPVEAEANHLVDRFGGLADLAARTLRAVGDPDARFREDALRMIRAVRLAATLDFAIEPATLAAITANAALAQYLSGERIAAELEKLLAAPRPSIGLALMARTGLLAVISPELAAQRGVPQHKHPGEDLWDHTLRAVDAAANRPVVRLAALVHDIGKPSTFADGHFPHHDRVGADLAAELLRRLHYPRTPSDTVAHLVHHHMFNADQELSDAAVRRFIKRIGPEHLDDLLALRRADDIGSAADPDADGIRAFRERVAAELHAAHPLDRTDLAIDGSDLMRELGLAQGPRLGRVIDALFEQVLNDPSLNTPDSLLLLAQGILADMDPDVRPAS